MKIAIASDHAGFKFKEKLKEHFLAQGHEVRDMGTGSEDPCDYPDYAVKAAGLVSDGQCEYAFLVCGSGIGMCMAANRLQGVRAAVLRDVGDAIMSRKHNDANVACLGARVTEFDAAIGLADTFLLTRFEGGRHQGRVAKIDCNR